MNLEDKMAQEMFLTENALKIVKALNGKPCSVYGSEAQEYFGKAIKNKESCKEGNKKIFRSDVEKMVNPIEWSGWRGRLKAFSFSIIENRTSAFEVYFGEDWIDGYYVDTSLSVDGAKELAQAFLVDLICSALGVESV